MFKFYKEWFSNYEHAEALQTASLVLFMVFFVSLISYVLTRPKKYYEEDSKLPLDEQ